MRWNELAEQECSVARTVAVVGDRWTLLVLREVFLGTRRFGDFLAHLGISRPLLKERLDKLVEHRVLRRVPYQERPLRREYRLTEKGLDLYPLITAMITWGDRWMAGPEGPPLELVHRPCNHAIHPVPCCPECGEPVDARQVEVRAGPGLGAASGPDVSHASEAETG